VFREDWNFAGLAKMARFGYALGQAAAEQAGDIRWLPGDEFEKAWQKFQSRAIDTDALFAGHPELKLAHFEPITYPPLAREARISGTVIAHVSVAGGGKVSQVKTEGHPLLAGIVRDRITMWVFEPGSERTFDLTCDFSFPKEWICGHPNASTVLRPLRLAVWGAPACVWTSAARDSESAKP